jgi:hypothetical protein
MTAKITTKQLMQFLNDNKEFLKNECKLPKEVVEQVQRVKKERELARK